MPTRSSPWIAFAVIAALAPQDGPRIDAFWRWWRTAAPRLAAAIDRGKAQSIADEVGAQVHAIDPRLAWETGPGSKGARHHFALSSEGDIELRVLAQRWLSRAPSPDATWEYYAARQPYGRGGSWSLALPGGVTIEQAGVSVAFETDSDRELIHLKLHHAAFAKLDERTRGMAAFLTLDNVLGEDGVERWVGNVDTSVAALPQGKSLDALAAAVKALEKSSTGERFAILKGEVDGQPVFATVNLALKRVDHLLMDDHLSVTIPLETPTPQGLTTTEEADALNALEDELRKALGNDAVCIGRETGQKKRIIHFHVSSSGRAEDRARAWRKRHSSRQMEITVRHDPSWEILRHW